MVYTIFKILTWELEFEHLYVQLYNLYNMLIILCIIITKTFF